MDKSMDCEREVLTHSPDETVAFGRTLADVLEPPKLVLLRGDLGAGKTTLVKGIAEAFDAAPADEVTSPTFTLVHEYRGPRFTVLHVDLYRIDTDRELDTLGLEDYYDDSRFLLLIEWGEKFSRFEKGRDLEISISRLGDTERRITLKT
jgi:tRNA threonylcarbamoyladenosine biosynthesis protein TsaE